MLAPVVVFAILATAPDVESRSQLELKVRGDFVVASPGRPTRFKAAGPGRMVAYVVTNKGAGDDPAEVDLDVLSGGASVFKERLSPTRVPGLSMVGGKTSFAPAGLKRVAFELTPKPRSYDFKVSAPTALAVFRVIQAPPGVRVPEIPVKPEGRAKTFGIIGKEKWHWASICEHVTVSVPAAGVLHVYARTQLGNLADLPPPTFLRALSEGRVKAAFPITSAPEQGIEFLTAGAASTAGTLRTLAINAKGPTDYEFELATWGCINGVGLQFDFAAGAAPETAETSPLVSASALSGATAVASATLPQGGDAGVSSEAYAQCGLQIDDLARKSALEYLDTMVESGVIPPSQLALEQANQLGDSFIVQNVSYAIDGAVMFDKEPPAEGGALAQRRVVPGPHTLEMKATLRGRGAGPFSYLNEYVIKLSKREAFVAESGKKYGLKVTLYDKGGFSTPFKERPGVKVELVPQG